MITEDYVSFETAKLLKEKGFNEECSRWYVANEPQEGVVEMGFGENQFYINAPTLQMAMKWLREIYKLCIVIIPVVTDDDGSGGCLWEFIISKRLEIKYKSTYEYEFYEEATEASIKYCLENLI